MSQIVSTETEPESLPASSVSPIVRESIRQALEGLRFGQITINIHAGEVVQIDRVARFRQFRSLRDR